MIKLRAKYNKGKIVIIEKNIPKIKAEATIQILEKSDLKKNKGNNILGKYKLSGIFDKENIRDIAYD